jgi:hypothetical protein
VNSATRLLRHSSRGLISEKIVLLIIDPQVDFHPEYNPLNDPRLSHKQGNLAVVGANEDSERIAAMILKYIDKIDEIYVTMDSHHVSLISR